MTRTTRRQAGFTLLELLTVIAIIAVLAALGAGAYFKARASQQEKLTGDTVVKLQKSLMQQMAAELDTAKKTPIPDIVKVYCQNDPDRAVAVWAYLHLRKGFPENVTEARSAVILPAMPPTIMAPTTIFPPSQVFLDRIPAAMSTLTADEQSAMCLYVSLMDMNRRGMEPGITDNMTAAWPPTATSAANQSKVFMDTFGRPIAFRRFLSNSEMQVLPLSKITTANKDPLDPLGKLFSLPAANRTAIETAIGGNRTIGQRTNFMMSVFSTGMNKKLDFSGTEPVGDDILGYRLMTEGKLN